MNKTCLIIYVFALTSMARAGLIDLTPGGTPDDFGPPTPVQIHGFYDEAAFGWFNLPEGRTFLRGWVSRFGILNGGQYFFTDLFTNDPSTVANVWWDFSGTDYRMLYIDVVGWNDDGTGLVANLYKVVGKNGVIGSGRVTLDGLQNITGISFYGRNPAFVPDSGSTVVLLGLAIFGVLTLRRWRAAQKAS
jgi:hypothetical protein